ncbi:MAG TPA: NUDIX domain-containing protein [Thermoguttaceae bacterium]|nr:NUDIX domain-containing protein [Thermoguttaceae bacterium]
MLPRQGEIVPVLLLVGRVRRSRYNGVMNYSETTPIEQASAVPYRLREGQPEFCLITSISSGKWGFPKGIIDPGETPRETATKEAEEEAGLHGRIVGEPIGQYQYHKWGTTLLVTVYLMEVTGVEDEWEEAELRERVWRRADEARAAVGRTELRRLLDAAVERIRSIEG